MTLPRGSIYKLCGLLLWLIGAIAASAWMAVHEEWILMSLCLIVGVVAVVKIIRFHFQNIRKLTYLFDSIENGDYAFKFTEYDGSYSDNMLNLSLNRIKDILVHARMETIQREKYYAEILDRVGTGVLVINAKGNVYQINRSALRMFGLPVVTHVNQLSVIDRTVSRTILALKSGEKQQLSFSTERGVSNLSVDASEMIVRDTPLRIIAMNDVHEELDEKENESWIRLIRILTHEIMNSVAPITSISDSLLSEKEQIPASAREGIEVIRTTSRGLVRFVESYRQLTRIPAPNCRPFYLRPFLERMRTLALQGQEKSVSVSIEIDVEPTDLLLYADEDQIGQVVLNLLKNALQALSGEGQGEIRIEAREAERGAIVVDVSDNGKGMPAEVAENVFVPFFTTKQDGSGIGLSLSRQIMRLHGGSLILKSTRPEGTVFRLTFQ